MRRSLGLPELPSVAATNAPQASAASPLVHREDDSFGSDIPVPRFRSLRGGCYLIRFAPIGGSLGLLTHYDGTLRVERQGLNTIASGDLYSHRFNVIFPPSLEPNPARGIPIFPRNRYRYYLRVTQILEGLTTQNSFTLGFERFLFDAPSKTWTNEGSFTAQMSWVPAPAGFPSSGNYLTGEVKDASNTVVGNLTMGWVSQYLRRAVVEIDRVPASEFPLNNGAGQDWQTIFDKIGWQVTVQQSNSDVVAPSGDSWSDAEMHAAMLARRDSANLDTQWRYHILCVKRIDRTPRGLMYDDGATDSNNVPREGIGIASHWVIPNSSEWGLVQGQRFGTAAKPYFRTALHEIGHAMGLDHNMVDNGVMNTTDTIAGNATTANPFPNNIQWSHAPDDQKRLRHLPDIYIRPGGTPYHPNYITIPISPDDESLEIDGLALRVRPVLEVLPLGAPVRVEVEMVNQTGYPIQVPADISLKSEFVTGQVTDPAGTTRSFSPFILCMDTHDLVELKEAQPIKSSLTLLRGAEGALFPTAGIHRIQVEISWSWNNVPLRVVGETNVIVTPAVNDSHATAALKLLTTPDSLLTLILGGDHLSDGIAAIQAGLNDATLRPHYAYTEAKRIGKRFGEREANLQGATALLEDAEVMNALEVKKAVALVQSAKTEISATRLKKVKQLLQQRAAACGADDETTQLVHAL